MNDLCTIVSYEAIMAALERFLNEYYKAEQDIHGLTIDTMKLIRIILQNQTFVFQNKIYRQIKDTEPRSLPYVHGHPHLTSSTLIRASLVRAVLCCSNTIDFDNERRDIDETFSTNGYTWDYIIDYVKQFFQEF
ncbi:unnamed protein product [Didymodactylos carnosus]|uniref:Helix-turn-helix domain-containing protein n=1 Tax=Didymodactylos carnosus TaxID=1234261 RepID=A0A816C0E1_9BILA|nr:unnamed protein product [Didymodactylos carnosus]CAF4502249.1 unnamed protein product [Didymodactylos carnosus]